MFPVIEIEDLDV